LLAALSAFCGCSNTTKAGGPAEKPIVEVVRVKQQDVPIYGEWIGTLDGFVNATIKAQVTGYLSKQDYAEGSFVKKGQPLFEIDPRPFRAALDQARGQLAQANGQLAQSKAQLLQAEAQLAVAEANQGKTQLDVDRYRPLAEQQAITQQDLDNAVQGNLAAKAQVQAAKAAVETAKAQIQAANAAIEAAKAAVETATLNMGFTRLISPIDGIAGTARQQVGDLASPSAPPVTTVSTVDPIRAYFTIGEDEYLSYHRLLESRTSVGAVAEKTPLELVLADGSVYPKRGSLFFEGRSVNQNTGAIRIAGLFPNPGNILRPGQYAKVRMIIRTSRGALLVPQRAVTELQGSYQVAVVADDGRVEIRTVKVGDRINTMWIITEGLKPGEQVVAEGVQKVRPGMIVQPRQFMAESEAERR
jgi:membrane fusion protein (multidrug efflux system)